MKIERISEHIWRVRISVFIAVQVWLVNESDGWTLVDAGLSFMAGGIRRFVEEAGGGPLRRILLTHGHGDHVGAIEALLASGDVTVYAHPREMPYMEGAKPYPRRKKARSFVRPGAALPLPLGEDGEPVAVGGLLPVWTPGHSPGHTVYYHGKDRVLLAGDLFTSRKGKLRPPMKMFTADMKQAADSAAVVARLMPDRLEICHGGPVLAPAEQLDEYFRTYAGAYRSGRARVQG